MSHRAECCCRACFIEAEGDPVFNGLCNCDSCRRRTGSAFGWSVYFADGQITATGGDFEVYEPRTASPARRWFCRACGSTLFWRAEALPGLTGIAGGCFLAPPAAPSLSAHDGARLDWVGLPETVVSMS